MRDALRLLPVIVQYRRNWRRTRAQPQLEILALRHQLTVLQRQQNRRPRLTSFDRVLWVWPYRWWPGCLDALNLLAFTFHTICDLVEKTWQDARQETARKRPGHWLSPLALWKYNMRLQEGRLLGLPAMVDRGRAELRPCGVSRAGSISDVFLPEEGGRLGKTAAGEVWPLRRAVKVSADTDSKAGHR